VISGFTTAFIFTPGKECLKITASYLSSIDSRHSIITVSELHQPFTHTIPEIVSVICPRIWIIGITKLNSLTKV
jgi:hypothetical protein